MLMVERLKVDDLVVSRHRMKVVQMYARAYTHAFFIHLHMYICVLICECMHTYVSLCWVLPLPRTATLRHEEPGSGGLWNLH